jgi:hypothetical protein
LRHSLRSLGADHQRDLLSAFVLTSSDVALIARKSATFVAVCGETIVGARSGVLGGGY